MGPQLHTVNPLTLPSNNSNRDDACGSLYLATIYEVCARTVFIHAESEASARSEARRMWADDIFVPSDQPAWREIDWVDVQPA
jgi:hypothetical protein